MYKLDYGDVHPDRNRYDAVREYCLCEKIDVDYMRYMIKRIGRDGNTMNMTQKQVGWKRTLLLFFIDACFC